MFHLLCKHLDFRQKYSATRRIFNSLFAFPEETLSLVFDMLREAELFIDGLNVWLETKGFGNVW